MTRSAQLALSNTSLVATLDARFLCVVSLSILSIVRVL
jgi:hypothetical protein